MMEIPKGTGDFLAAVVREMRVTGAVYAKTINRDLGIVLGICGHWWQAETVPEAMHKDCPTCGRPPGVFIGYWDETWPEPDDHPFTEITHTTIDEDTP